MILDYKKIDLFGKIVFETVILKPPHKKPNLMHDALHVSYQVGSRHSCVAMHVHPAVRLMDTIKQVGVVE